MEIKDFVRKEIIELEEHEYAPKREQMKDKYDLSLNINPCGISKRVSDRLSKIDPNKINHYYPENTELINEIAAYTGVNNEQILLGDGCDGCLGLLANTFINKGERVIIPIPTFHRYEFHTRIMGGTPVFIPMKNFEINVEEIISLSKDAKMIFLCNPNNPTGKQITKKDIEELTSKFNGVVVVDEALADVTEINGFDLLKKYENLIFVRSFSKAFGLASLRIGYVISNPEIIKQTKKTSSPFKVNGLAQELGIEALKDKEYIQYSREYINTHRSFLINHLNALGFQCTQSVATNFLVDISKIGPDSKVAVELLNKMGILVTDAATFRVPENKYIRVTIGSKNENEKFIEAMTRLSEKRHTN